MKMVVYVVCGDVEVFECVHSTHGKLESRATD